MKGKEDDKARVLSIVALLLCFILLETNAMAANKIVLQKYPGLKLGLLNVNCMKQWPLGLESAKKTIDNASEQGYWWIEVRDPLASLTLTQAKALAAYAEQKGIEIACAMAVGFLDHNFWEVFSRGLASSAVFEGRGSSARQDLAWSSRRIRRRRTGLSGNCREQ